MVIATINWRVSYQIPSASYFSKTFEIASAADFDRKAKKELEKILKREEKKIRKDCGDELVELRVDKYY